MQLSREQVKGSDKTLLVIDSVVYDVTSFAEFHPGGQQILLDLKGKDATEQFYGLHRQEVLEKYKKLRVGTIKGEQPKILKNEGISKVPYAEPSFWQGFHSPYYTEAHKQFRAALRAYLAAEIKEEALKCEEAGASCPPSLLEKLGRDNILAMMLGPGPHLQNRNLFGVKPQDFDYFFEMIVHEEFSMIGCPALMDSIDTALLVGLPPVINFGPQQLKDTVVPDIIAGKKRICLAITEPGAGSDVANIKTRAVLSPDGKHYIVNGVKKWITGGYEADFFTTAVVTDGGISMLLVPRSAGVDTKRIATSYSPSAGTSLVVFENALVPVENLLGVEGGGFQIIMYNFNHERWYIIASLHIRTRFIIEECFKWANQREVFGKKLISQPVIRYKLANMISLVETVYSYLELITYQMTKMSYKEQAAKLAGPLALLKFRATRCAHDVSDDACQIFGGRAITRTGMGRFIEHFQRSNKMAAIPGGSEEIMADLGVRQAMRKFPKNARL
ncbi:acyl-CoA dehydrogenase/oxidase [Gorgonomyces haynaldii]|nr:acyl-CoA dehydrogenase/oxidase [Gorgonomyces haynaldii]